MGGLAFAAGVGKALPADVGVVDAIASVGSLTEPLSPAPHAADTSTPKQNTSVPIRSRLTDRKDTRTNTTPVVVYRRDS